MNLGSVPKRDTNLSCKRVVCTKSTISDRSKLPKKRDVKTSSSKTTRTWYGSCNKLLCSFGESKSRPSSPSQVSFVKKNETKSSLAHPSVSVTEVKSVETSTKVQRDSKNDSRTVMTGSKQSNPSSLNKVVPPAVVKKQIQNTGPKDTPMRNLFSKILINQSPKDPPPYNLRKRVEKSQASKDSPTASMKRETSKPEGPKASSVATVKRETHKTEVLKASIVAQVKMEPPKIEGPKTEREIPAPSTKKIDTAKQNHPSSSQKRPWSDEPVYHIRWEGYEKEYELSGQKCMLCDMDLSISPSGNNDESLENNDYDDEYDDEYQYKPKLLPAVDFLSCGHVFHTECLTSTDLIADEQSTDPKCIFCLSMV